MLVRGLTLTILGLLLVLAAVPPALAQQRPDTTQAPTPSPDTTTAPPTADSLRQAAQQGAAPGGPSGASSNAVSFSAKDSLVIHSDTAGSDRGRLHGNAKMSYQEATLRGGTIELNFQTGTLQAEGAPSDTAQGGRPVFEQGGGSSGTGGGGGGGQSFTGDVLSYNLSTKRGRVVAARTEKRNAFIEGGAVKMFEDSTLFVQDGSYTTCDCPPGVTPSYSLRSDEMKVEGDWVYTGPIQLFLFNVPTPLWLPFGFLPSVSGRRSGPLPPQYGEDQRGFFLKNWGWYFALNPYTDLTLQASVWSKGSFEIRPRFRYNKRYNYNGNLQLTYRRVRIGESADPDRVRRHEGQIDWQHSQTLSPTARLSGDVNLVTSGDFAQRNSDSFNDAVRQDISSSVRYRKSWSGGERQFNVSASQNQQLRTGETRMTLPSLSFTQNRFKPFKQEQRIGDERWYERITTSYQVDVDNQYNFTPRDLNQLRQRGDSTLADSLERAGIGDIDWYEALVDREKYQLATGDDKLYDFQATHQIPLSMSFRVDRYNLSLSPNAQYTSDWYINTVRRVAIRDSTGGVDEIVERSKPGFYARRQFNTSFSANSELFGTFPIGLGPFEGLRHRLSPSLSANYRPNFNAPFWGRTRRVRFEDGTPVPRDSLNESPRYDIVGGAPIRSSTEQWSLNFSLRNVFETKRVRVDSTGERQTNKINLLNLDVSGLSYNFAADSFRVGRNISLNARTQIDPFNISARSSFSPYVLERRSTTGGETRFAEADRLMIAESPLTPVRLTDFRFSLSADFSSEGGGGRSFSSGQRGQPGRGGQFSRPNQQGARTQGGRQRNRGASQTESTTALTEFDLPWSLSFDFNYSLRKPRKEITDRSATLSADFTLNVTPLWRVQGNTGYDFIDDKVSTTRLSISRSLGCWDMSFSWVPFGRFQQYQFNLQVSSGQLSQLLQLQIPNQGGEGRFGGFGQRLRNTATGAAGVRGGAGGGFP